MAGSLNHIIDNDGTFTMRLIENLGDAHEALEECFALIHDLSGGDMAKVSAACEERNFVDPYDEAEGEADGEGIPKAMSVPQTHIVAAAIMTLDGVIHSVKRPGRHHDVIKAMHDIGIRFKSNHPQGFLLNTGRFVDRRPAKQIAIKAGQMKKRRPDIEHLKDLYSEDLW